MKKKISVLIFLISLFSVKMFCQSFDEGISLQDNIQEEIQGDITGLSGENNIEEIESGFENQMIVENHDEDSEKSDVLSDVLIEESFDQSESETDKIIENQLVEQIENQDEEKNLQVEISAAEEEAENYLENQTEKNELSENQSEEELKNQSESNKTNDKGLISETEQIITRAGTEINAGESNRESEEESEIEEKQRPKWLDEILNSDIPFFKRLDFVFGFEPTMYTNMQSKTISAPSPIVYPIYFGFHWPNNTFVSLQPSFRFFRSYYLVNDDMVLPAEIENRTVDAWSCLLNVPVVFKFDLWDVSNLKAFAGLAFLIRIPTIAEGVSSSDWGYYGTVADDFKYIKKWLVGSWRFLYLSTGVDWMYKLSDTIQIGPEMSLFFPLGAVFSDWTFDAFMVSIGVKVAF